MTKCERCGKETRGTIMSFFNTQTICMECSEAERKHPRYAEARDADVAAIRRGDYNFPGIGWKPMPFEEWRQAKRLVSITDEAVLAYLAGTDLAEGTEHCLVYPGGLVIECPGHERFVLQLPGEEEVGDDLERLERRLFEFGAANGVQMA